MTDSDNGDSPDMTVVVSEKDEGSEDSEDEENSDVASLSSTGSGALLPPKYQTRRDSKWSAEILFVSSDVQLIFNLAEWCPPDGYETAPKKGSSTASSSSENRDQEVIFTLDPMDGNDDSESEDRKDISNGTVHNGIEAPKPPERTNTDRQTVRSDKKANKDIERGESPPRDPHAPRENWGGKADYLLAVIGYAVDLSNVWRFPYLCYKNGGGAFIIPYFTVMVVGAIPIFFMELALGQFHRQGPVTVWKIVPICKGIGYASCYMAYIVAFYYNVVIAWAFFYLFSSFTSSLPWTSCNNSWNSPDCWELDHTPNATLLNSTYNANTSVSSAFEFFERGMLNLHLSKGLGDLGPINWKLVLCMMLTFTILYFCLWKGVKSSGKVVWVTATVPYLILTILLIRGAFLPGAIDGIKYFITPNLSRLRDPEVWIDAAVQIFFSIGCGFGTHIAFASYNHFHNNCHWDCLFTCAVNSFTSIFSGFVVFAYLGYMALRQNKHINDVAQEGPGLVFIVYPEAIATLPGSIGWAIVFFLMLLTLGLDSAFGGLESPLTGFRDVFQKKFNQKWSREIFTLIVISSAFLFSLPCITQGGMYVFKILDTFAAGTSIVFAVLCQVIAVSWLYGIDQFCTDIAKMTGKRPGLYWRVCWKFLSPTFLLIIVISSFLHYVPLVYKGGMGTYVYPTYANVIGWLISASSMAMIPTYAIYKLSTTPGTFKERLALCISPVWEHKEIREKKDVRRFQKKHWTSL